MAGNISQRITRSSARLALQRRALDEAQRHSNDGNDAAANPFIDMSDSIRNDQQLDVETAIFNLSEAFRNIQSFNTVTNNNNDNETDNDNRSDNENQNLDIEAQGIQPLTHTTGSNGDDDDDDSSNSNDTSHHSIAAGGNNNEVQFIFDNLAMNVEPDSSDDEHLEVNNNDSDASDAKKVGKLVVNEKPPAEPPPTLSLFKIEIPTLSLFKIEIKSFV